MRQVIRRVLHPNRAPFGFLVITLAGCAGESPNEPPSTSGTLVVSVTTTGVEPDPDGYSLRVGGGFLFDPVSQQPLPMDTTVSFDVALGAMTWS